MTKGSDTTGSDKGYSYTGSGTNDQVRLVICLTS